MTISIDPAAEAATIRPAGSREVDRLSRALALAFYDDPVFTYLWPRPMGRFDRLVRYFGSLALQYGTMPYGHVYTTDGIAGGALWVPPGERIGGTADMVRLVPTMLRVWGRDLVHALRGVSAMEEHHPHEDHWYLMFVGVAPEWRGAGVGSALMRPVLHRADDDGTPSYLQATSPQNRRLYERLGFEVTREIRLPKGPPMWDMWREPEAG